MNTERTILIAGESGIAVHTFSDIIDTLSACFGADGLILTEADLAPEFFQLRSGLAGELFQKFINYRIPLALVLPDPNAYGERFRELAHEHATHNQIRFVRSLEEAQTWLAT